MTTLGIVSTRIISRKLTRGKISTANSSFKSSLSLFISLFFFSFSSSLTHFLNFLLIFFLFIHKVYRDYRVTKNRKFLFECWNAVEEALKYISKFDKDGDGLIENEGFPDQTYDTYDTLCVCERERDRILPCLSQFLFSSFLLILSLPLSLSLTHTGGVH